MKRRLAAPIAALMVVGGGALALTLSDKRPPLRPAAARTELALLTSLPLVFGEQFSLQRGGSPTLERLEQSYRVEPIAVADAASLKGRTLLLMAHPRAQPAEMLVELDRWVRRGGRVLLLADPKLDWDSDLPLGDPLRPPLLFADTGLLAHWGVTLDGPVSDGPVTRRGGEGEVLTSSPGRLSAGRRCEATADGLMARCRIGAGRATIIADADFLNVAGPGALDGPTSGNLDLLTRELAILERSR